MILSKEHREIAKKIAQKSMVLLKNEKYFAFYTARKNRACRSRGQSQDILGAWSWQGKKEKPFPSWLGPKN